MRIDSFRFGRVVIDGKEYSSDLIVYDDHVDPSWWRQEGHLLRLGDLKQVLRRPPHVLVVGQGAEGKLRVAEDLEAALGRRGIELRCAPTAEAGALFNELSQKDRRVYAVLHLTC